MKATYEIRIRLSSTDNTFFVKAEDWETAQRLAQDKFEKNLWSFTEVEVFDEMGQKIA